MTHIPYIGTLHVTSLRALNPNMTSKAAQERTWQMFLKGGTSHSAQAHTLPYIINRCEREGIPYQLKAMPGSGYYISPLKDNA
jgi:hypothetical protein